MKKILLMINLLMIVLMLFSISCQQSEKPSPVQSLSTESTDAGSPYLTYDNQGNPVLCWTERSLVDSLYRLRYTIYKQAANKFADPVTVSPSAGTKSSAESMNKIAFKSDGTVIAVFARKFENQKNPFAGAILYTTSSDEGKTWEPEKYLHSDTSHTYGRGYFDLARMKNGEIAAIWLDGRYGKTIKGSALYFARTEKDKGFEKDSCLAKGTCECCRTDLLTDEDGNIHIAYRSISFPIQQLGKQVRDMTYTVSKDNGNTFSPAIPVSNDNWVIEGCPHSGPSLSITNKTVNAVWYTAGGSPGLYSASFNGTGSGFTARSLVTSSGRHPQMISLPDSKLAMVYEETSEMHHEAPMNMNSSNGSMPMKHSPAGNAKIVLRILSRNNNEILPITDGHQADHHAVIAATNEGLLIAWIREENGRSKICYSQINMH